MFALGGEDLMLLRSILKLDHDGFENSVARVVPIQTNGENGIDGDAKGT